MLLRGSDDRAPGTVGGPITTESPVIAGNRIQPETSEASVYADCLDDCHAEGRGFESHQPLSKDPANRGVLYFSHSPAWPRSANRLRFRGANRPQKIAPRSSEDGDLQANRIRDVLRRDQKVQ